MTIHTHTHMYVFYIYIYIKSKQHNALYTFFFLLVETESIIVSFSTCLGYTVTTVCRNSGAVLCVLSFFFFISSPFLVDGLTLRFARTCFAHNSWKPIIKEDFHY